MALWFERRSALEIGDTANAADRIEEMVHLVRTERLDRIPWLARGFAYEGYEHLREGNYERAREAFDNARRFDPRLAEAQTGYAWAALKAGKGVGTFLEEYRKSLLLRWETLQRDGAANFYFLSLAVIWILALVVVLVFLLRYQRMIRHDVAERMPRGWVDGPGRVAGWAVLLAPLLFWIGGVWVLLYWCVLLGAYLSGSERALAVLVCVAVIVTGPLAAQGVVTAAVGSDPTVLAVEEALQGGYGAGVISALKRALRAEPDSRSLRLLLGNAYDRAGLQREAFEEYQTILKSHPDDPKALNNVGNLYMRSGQTAQALLHYARAVERSSATAAFYHNLYLAQSEAIRPADAEASLKRVQEIDPDLAKRLLASRSGSEETLPLLAVATPEEVRAEIPGADSGGGEPPLSASLRSPTAIGAMVALVLLAWVGLTRSPQQARICMRCGEPFCGRCKRELGAKEYCAQCIHLFVKRDSIAAATRALKLDQVDRFSRKWRRRVRAFTLILPGAGHLLGGKTIQGLLLLVAWLVPLTTLLLGPRLMLPASLPVLDLPAVTTIAAALLMVALWAAANVTVPRPPSA